MPTDKKRAEFDTGRKGSAQAMMPLMEGKKIRLAALASRRSDVTEL
jgi:hypothetical protein